MPSYCISDLHLQVGENDLTTRFAQFCIGLPGKAERLYVLGDLVDAWLGDDTSLGDYQAVVGALGRLTRNGVAVTLLSGNHDFLYGEAFRAATGVRLAADPLPVVEGDRAYLLSHGDVLCTADRAYQDIRSTLRSSAWQRDFLASPVTQQRAFAARLRAQSRADSAGKSMQIMDVVPGALSALYRQHGIDTLIHGHTHRPGIHADPGGEGFARRVVLGCWRDRGEIARIDADGVTLLCLDDALARIGSTRR